MKLLDTNTLTHLFASHPRVVEQYRREVDEVATTVINRVEILKGRFATLLKAATGQELRRAQTWLDQTVELLDTILSVPIDDAAADTFDRLRENKNLRKIGRADLLIAAITLANRATLVTRNLKDFRLVLGLQVENWVD